MTAAAELEDTGERMVPEFHKGKLIYAEHLIRYQVVSALVKGKVVLDIASGSGYGTAILAETAKKVYGFDADRDAVEYAEKHFSAPNVEFGVGDATQIALPDASVDVVITFETIEHIEDYEKFVSEIRRVLKPNGIAVVSTPNDLEFAEGNHFHLHEFDRDEFLGLVSKYFKNVEEYYEATWKYAAIDTMSAFQTEGEVVRRVVNTAPILAEQVLYFYFVCSNVAITQTIEPLSAVGEHYSERALVKQFMLDQAELSRLARHEEELAVIKASRSFRLASRVSKVAALLHLQRTGPQA